jgi:hypothetical protein
MAAATRGLEPVVAREADAERGWTDVRPDAGTRQCPTDLSGGTFLGRSTRSLHPLVPVLTVERIHDSVRDEPAAARVEVPRGRPSSGYPQAVFTAGPVGTRQGDTATCNGKG